MTKKFWLNLLMIGFSFSSSLSAQEGKGTYSRKEGRPLTPPMPPRPQPGMRTNIGIVNASGLQSLPIRQMHSEGINYVASSTDYDGTFYSGLQLAGQFLIERYNYPSEEVYRNIDMVFQYASSIGFVDQDGIFTVHMKSIRNMTQDLRQKGISSAFANGIESFFKKALANRFGSLDEALKAIDRLPINNEMDQMTQIFFKEIGSSGGGPLSMSIADWAGAGAGWAADWVIGAISGAISASSRGLGL